MRFLSLYLIVTSLIFGSKAQAIEARLSLDQLAQWPMFRGNQQNTGFTSQKAHYTQDQPWAYSTAKGIFSTAVIDKQGQIYVGSADKSFYVLSPEGKLVWQLATGEIIDSSALLSQNQEGQGFVTIPSGDGNLYHLNASTKGLAGLDRIEWTFNAANYPHPKAVGYTWFEGNVGIDNQGRLLAGNTNWNFYAIDGTSGELDWVFPSGNMNWSIAAVDANGDVYWTSLDRSIRKMTANTGEIIWSKKTLGFNSSSPALDNENRLFFGSFDGSLYAMDTNKGKTLWTFKTQDHIYASPALSFNKDKSLKRIYISSTDGQLYALSPNGKLIWSFDTGAVIRSSPVVGQSPDNKDIIYFGAANGLVYAVNENGQLRWAFDTNSDVKDVIERNDLNSSPALGKTGLVIGGEHGFLWYVPYDFPMHHPAHSRSILKLKAKSQSGTNLSITSELTSDDGLPVLRPTSIINIDIRHYNSGQLIKAGLNSWHQAESFISIEPEIDFTWSLSGSAKELYIRPKYLLDPGQIYTVHINGTLMKNGLTLGNLELGASKFIPVNESIRFKVIERSATEMLVDTNNDLPFNYELTRLALPSPSMIPSLNQIGFDSLHWFLSIIAKIPDTNQSNEGSLIAWLTEVKRDNSDISIDVNSSIKAALVGRYEGNHFILKAHGLSLEVAGIKLSIKELELRGQLTSAGDKPSAVEVYADINPFTDINYGPLLALSGLVNSHLKIPTTGSFLAKPYIPKESGPAKFNASFLGRAKTSRFKSPTLEFKFEFYTDTNHALPLNVTICNLSRPNQSCFTQEKKIRDFPENGLLQVELPRTFAQKHDQLNLYAIYGLDILELAETML